jgi:hypothetical protein
MPTVFLLIAAAVFSDLRLTADMMGLRVRARLLNAGSTPVEVTVGDKCSGPAFWLVIDGERRHFSGTGRACAKPVPMVKTLGPGEDYVTLSDTLDGRRHRILLRFGDLTAPPIDIQTTLHVDVKLTAPGHAKPGQTLMLEVAHVNHSPEAVTFPSCGEDRLLVDGKEIPMAPADPCRPEPRILKERGAFITRGTLQLPAGRHFVRARWHETQSDDVIIDVGE